MNYNENLQDASIQYPLKSLYYCSDLYVQMTANVSDRQILQYIIDFFSAASSRISMKLCRKQLIIYKFFWGRFVNKYGHPGHQFTDAIDF